MIEVLFGDSEAASMTASRLFRRYTFFTKLNIASYKLLWNTLVERNRRKEDLRIAAGLATNMIANMVKGKNISMETLVRICEALNCGILDVIELEQDKDETENINC